MTTAMVTVKGIVKEITEKQSAARKTPFRNVEVAVSDEKGYTRPYLIRAWKPETKIEVGKEFNKVVQVQAYLSKGVVGLSFDCW